MARVTESLKEACVQTDDRTNRNRQRGRMRAMSVLVNVKSYFYLRRIK